MQNELQRNAPNGQPQQYDVAELARDNQLARRYRPIDEPAMRNVEYVQRHGYNELPIPGLGALPVNPRIPVELAREYAVEQYGGLRPGVKITEPQRQFGHVISQVADILDNNLFKGREAQVNLKSDIFYRMMKVLTNGYREHMITENFGPAVVSAGDMNIPFANQPFIPITVNVRFNKLVTMRATHKGLTLYYKTTFGPNQVLVPYVNFGKQNKRSYEFSLTPYYGYSDTVYNITSVVAHNAGSMYVTGALENGYESLCAGCRVALKSPDLNTFYNRLSIQLPRESENAGFTGLGLIARTLEGFVVNMISRQRVLTGYGLWGARTRPGWMTQGLHNILIARFPLDAILVNRDPYNYDQGMFLRRPYVYEDAHFADARAYQWDPINRALIVAQNVLPIEVERTREGAIDALLDQLATDIRHYLNASLVASRFVLQIAALPRLPTAPNQAGAHITNVVAFAETFVTRYPAADLDRTGTLGISLADVYRTFVDFIRVGQNVWNAEAVATFVGSQMAVRPFKLTPNNVAVTTMTTFVDTESAVNHCRARAIAAAATVNQLGVGSYLGGGDRSFVLDLSGVTPQAGLTCQVSMTLFPDRNVGVQYLYTQQWLRSFNYTKKLELEKIAGARVDKYVKSDTNNLKQLVATLGGKYNERKDN